MDEWRNKLYRLSEDAIDVIAIYTNRLEREIAYWFSPEQATESGFWIAQALIPIELTLLLGDAEFGSTVFLGEAKKAVQRWRDTFFGVWDGEWELENRTDSIAYPYNELSYRKQHRPAVKAIFERLESIADLWAGDASLQPDLIPLLPEYPLPFFSRYPRYNVGFGDLIEYPSQLIIYYLSAEMRHRAWPVYQDVIPVLADVLGMICEAHKCSPGFKAEMIRNWREMYFQMHRQFLAEGGTELNEDDELIRAYKAAFNRLEAVATKYPSPYDWLD